MQTAFYILGIVAIIATALPLLRYDAWWIRILDFPRLQILVLGAAALAGILAFGRPFEMTGIVIIFLMAAVVAYQAYMMFPYTPFARKQVDQSEDASPENTVAILFANVLMTNRNAAGLLGQIRDIRPDVVLLAETDEWWAGAVAELEDELPHSVLQPQDNTYGLLLYSRLELIDTEVKFLVQDDVPSIHGKLRLPSGRLVEFRCLHPRPPVPTEEDSSSPRDAEILIVGKENRDTNLPFVVFGDLNDVAWSRTNYLFQNISGLLDPRIGRGFYHTFHATLPLIKFPLDHLFHSNHFRLVDFRCLERFGSDHLPVYIKLSLEHDAKDAQEEPEPSEGDVTEAEEAVAFAKEPAHVRNA